MINEVSASIFDEPGGKALKIEFKLIPKELNINLEQLIRYFRQTFEDAVSDVSERDVVIENLKNSGIREGENVARLLSGDLQDIGEIYELFKGEIETHMEREVELVKGYFRDVGISDIEFAFIELQ